MVFDEYHKAPPEVKRIIAAYLFGKRTIPFENSVLDLKPTPLILLNPLKRGGSLLERLGIDEAQQRRLIVFLLDDCRIPEEIEDKGSERLQEAKRMGPVELKRPHGLSDNSRQRIKDAIKALVRSKECLRFLDFTMVLSTIEGLTGYLGETFAVRAGTVAYARSLFTCGFAKDDWREKVDGILRPKKAAVDAVAPRGQENSFDYTRNLRLLHEALRALGRGHGDLARVMDDYVAIVGVLRDIGLRPNQFFDFVRETRANTECPQWIGELLKALREGKTLQLSWTTDKGGRWINPSAVWNCQGECQRQALDSYSWKCLNEDIQSEGH